VSVTVTSQVTHLPIFIINIVSGLIGHSTQELVTAENYKRKLVIEVKFKIVPLLTYTRQFFHSSSVLSKRYPRIQSNVHFVNLVFRLNQLDLLYSTDGNSDNNMWCVCVCVCVCVSVCVCTLNNETLLFTYLLTIA